MSLWPGTPDSVTTVAAADGVELTLERFDAADGPAGRAVIFIHGIGSYPGPYRRFARALAQAGTTVYLPHLRGHGSSGTRGRMGTPDNVLRDIGSVVERARADGAREVVLGGESMGGLFALAYTASGRTAPDRLLLLVPALRPNWLSWFGTARDVLSLPLFASIEDRVKVVHAPINNEPTRSEQFSQGTRADPNMLPKPPLGYLLTIGLIMLDATGRYAPRVACPCLILQAEADRVLDARAARRLATRMPHAEFETIPDAWHNVLWDPTAEATTARVADWLSRAV